MRNIAVLAALLFGLACARPVEPARPRVIFVGLDGADWQLLDRLIADGTMPSLGALARDGARGPLLTQRPPLSPLVWTTMMTGLPPLRHRILDFTRYNPATRQREPITSDERAVPAIWNMVSSVGRRVDVVGLWATYPPERVNGTIVSDREIVRQGGGSGEGRADDAIAAFENALRVDPNHAATKWNLSRSLLLRGKDALKRSDCAAALKDFARAAELAPDDALAFASRGTAQLCLGDERAAQASFRRSLDIDPSQPLH